jgi:hypothetical protein
MLERNVQNDGANAKVILKCHDRSPSLLLTHQKGRQAKTLRLATRYLLVKQKLKQDMFHVVGRNK